MTPDTVTRYTSGRYFSDRKGVSFPRPKEPLLDLLLDM